MRLNQMVVHAMAESVNFHNLTRQVFAQISGHRRYQAIVELGRMCVGSDILFGPLAASRELAGKDMGSKSQDGTSGRRRCREARTVSCKASVEEGQ